MLLGEVCDERKNFLLIGNGFGGNVEEFLLREGFGEAAVFVLRLGHDCLVQLFRHHRVRV